MPVTQLNSISEDEGTIPGLLNKPDPVCIYRASSKERGHYLHVSINRNGKLYQKYFPEKRFGGEQNTMKLARAWRDTIIAKHPPMSMGRFCSIVRSNNTSGVPGVFRSVTRNRAKNGRFSELAYWQARIPMADGKFRIEKFSVKKLSDEGAKQCAIGARMRGLSELDDIAFREKHLPQPVSTRADIALLEKNLRAPAERRAQQAAARETKREQSTLRAADRLAQALATEQEALDRAAKRNGEQYIGRYATPQGTNCYWRVSFQRQGTKYRKCFSDAVHGGTAEALIAAKAWRDQLFCTLPIVSKATFVARVKANNTSGVAGVTRMREVRDGDTCDSWVAYSPQKKGMPHRTRKYSIAKYGEDEAFVMAVKARETFVAELREVEFLQHPGARHLKRFLQIN